MKSPRLGDQIVRSMADLSFWSSFLFCLDIKHMAGSYREGQELGWLGAAGLTVNARL